jgi:hypothetical protein
MAQNILFDFLLCNCTMNQQMHNYNQYISNTFERDDFPLPGPFECIFLPLYEK